MKNRILHISFALALTAFSAPCLALANDAASAPKSRYTVDTTISDLLANPKAAQVLQAFVQQKRVEAGKPALTTEQEMHMVQMIENMTPRQVAKFPQVHLDDAGLDQLNALLAQIPAGSTSNG
jgi:hypothetical protein